jgi:hypothetical protein
MLRDEIRLDASASMVKAVLLDLFETLITESGTRAARPQA